MKDLDLGPRKLRKGHVSRRRMSNRSLTNRVPMDDPRRSISGPATSLRALADMMGVYAGTALREARYCAVQRWLMDNPEELSYPTPVVAASVKLLRENNLASAGLRHPDGMEWFDVLPRLSEGSQEEARSVVAQSLVDWARARGPHLGPAKVADTHLFMVACIKASAQGLVN